MSQRFLEARPSWARASVRGTAAVAAAFLAGIVLGIIGGRFGPAAMVAAPLVPLAAVAVLVNPVVGIGLVFASFPAGFLPFPTDALGVQATEAVVFAVVVIVVFRRLGTGETPLPWAAPLWWGALLLAWAVVTTPGAADLGTALKQDAQLLGALLFALVTLAALRSMDNVRSVLAVLATVGSGMALYGLRDVLEARALFGGAVIYNRQEGVFPHPNDLGAFCAILLMVTLGLTFGARGRAARLGGAAATIALLVGLTASFSRGAWMAAVFSGGLLLFLLPRARRALVLVGVPLLLLGGVLLLTVEVPDNPQLELVTQRIESLTRPADNPYDDRPSIYREALRQIREEPLTGTGAGSFPVTSSRSGSVARTVRAVHAHNVLLTVGAEIGLPGVALLVALTLSVGMTAIRATRRLADARNRAVLAGVASGLFAQVVQGVVDFNLRNPVILLMMAGLVGVVLAIDRQLRGTPGWREAGPDEPPSESGVEA